MGRSWFAGADSAGKYPVLLIGAVDVLSGQELAFIEKIDQLLETGMLRQGESTSRSLCG